jgi:protein-S-isoprenylcysteine O-methyltransferase Ste14
MVFTARFIFFVLAHSLGATNRLKQIFSRISGREPRSYRLCYNLASFAMIIWVMAAYHRSAVLYFAPGIWSLVLYAAQILVAVVIFRCVRQTGTGDFLGISQLSSAGTHPMRLITNGHYAHMRHPLYFYSAIFLILNPVMTVQWLLLTLYSLLYFILGGLIEERRLINTFGEEYRRYQQHVPFIIPALHNFKQ